MFLINVLNGINVLVLNSKVYQHAFLRYVLPNKREVGEKLHRINKRAARLLGTLEYKNDPLK